MSKSRILLAVGNENISKILRKYIEKAEDLSLIDQEVMHFRYLEEIIEIHEPDLLIVHDVFLPSDTKGKEERELEWLNFFHSIKQKYDNLRIVFLCERSKDDIFLNQTVGLGVFDIFNETAIDMGKFIEQLSNPARYANVAKFRGESFATFKVKPTEEQKSESEDDEKESQEGKNEQQTDSSNDSEEQEAEEDDEAAPKEKSTKRKKVKPEKSEKVKEKVIERLVPLPIEKKIILIGAPFKRNGSTFVSHLLAKEIANLDMDVTYIENPFDRAYTYDRFNGNHKLDSYRSVFFSHTKDEQTFEYTTEWIEEGINLIAKHPDEDVYSEDEVTFEVFIKILLKNQSPVTIIDVGSDWKRGVIRELFEVASHAFMIIEPDISDAHYLEDPNNESTAYYRYIVEHERTHIIGNRMDESMLKNKLIDELYGEKIITTVPAFNSSVVFKCQDKAIFVNDAESKVDTNKMVQPILEQIIPDKLLRRSNKKSKLFALFSK